MKKVLVADDEYLVRLGLKTTVDWAGHGFEIVGEAANGQEALEIFDRTDPDILLTDIKMPVMDGLELIGRLKAKKPSLYVVILTHYGDFSYAQQAMLLGASEYILKSELNEESILRTLERFSDALRRDVKMPQGGQSALKYYLRRCLLLPSDQPRPWDESVLDLPQGRYAVAACQCDTAPVPEETQEMFHRTIGAMMEKTWEKALIISAENGDLLRLYMVMPLRGGHDAFEKVRLSANNICQYYDAEFQAGVSGPGERGDLPELLNRAEAALTACFFSDDNCRLYAPSEPGAREGGCRVNQALLADLFQARAWPPVKEYIQSLFDELKEAGRMRDVVDAFTDLLGFVRLQTSRYPLLKTAFEGGDKLDYAALSRVHHIRTARMYALDVYRTALDALSGGSRRYSSIVNRTVEYVAKHFMDNIALSDAADAVGVSKSYLSLLFKQETGINFSKYLMDYRIEQAKVLLRDTNLKIYEIADRVGFPNPYYFSKVFKDTTGLSCKDFKNAN